MELGASRIVVESCSQDVQDARVIAAAIAANAAIGRVRFDIVSATSEEMLWDADVIGWAWGSGGRDRAAIGDVVIVHGVR